ncbi:hypothetical protein [Pseudothauera rhizosphaerae]|uniref:Uncharacterized protein n=1 Tax=Pseudothauera rhizosphaerae TaxID=2565932 RepID=A0A4V6RWY5_9RHOO|nr:hypothetical protein [Pseudothauera rhizosphaerae]THF55359.1 hypothetical protein E6O51_20695 [Pseudothauera rhizosphaerae]
MDGYDLSLVSKIAAAPVIIHLISNSFVLIFKKPSMDSKESPVLARINNAVAKFSFFPAVLGGAVLIFVNAFALFK